MPEFCVDGGIGKSCHAGIFVAEVCVNLLDHIGTHLIGGIDTALQHKCLSRINSRVTYKIFKMPLYDIDPIFFANSTCSNVPSP